MHVYYIHIIYTHTYIHIWCTCAYKQDEPFYVVCSNLRGTCMRTCVYTHIYICIYVCTCLHICIHTRRHNKDMHACVYTYIYMHTYVTEAHTGERERETEREREPARESHIAATHTEFGRRAHRRGLRRWVVGIGMW